MSIYPKKVLLGTVVVLAALTAGIIVYKMLKQPTITIYKDEQFWIYECSRPIKAKEGTVPSLFGGRMESLVPADQDEAKRYCKATGIE